MVRVKNRYLAIEINQESQRPTDSLHLRPSSLHHSIMEKVQELHGDFGVAAIMAGFTAKYCNEKTRIAIIRCRHGPHRLVASSIPFIKFIEQKAVQIKTLYTGATIRQCFKFLQKYQQRKFDEYCMGLTSDEEKAELKKAIMNLDPIINIK